MTMITRPKTRAMPTVPRAASWEAFAITAPQPANTRAKAARPSASARRRSSGRATASLVPGQVLEQRSDAVGDLVTDAPDGHEVPSRGVLELPILVSLAGIDRARIAAAHRDHDVRGPDDLVGQRLREFLRKINPDLCHRLDGDGVDLVGWIRAGGPNMDTARSELIQEAGRHLTSPGVVHADEQHLGHIFGHCGENIALTRVISIDICK